jgi:hypothetical protein
MAEVAGEIEFARVVELVDTLVLGTSSQEWEFESPPGHQTTPNLAEEQEVPL